ncbi:MAG: thioredoxin fold domain-containing protein [Deltaproteobacteria bacterium]|nr:thioredoxin fold domain-containing protein [Deltaproteobacteria bacterium]
MAEKLVNVNDAQFVTEVEKSDIPVLVDFGATWCAPCKGLGITLDGMVDSYKGKVKFCYVDIQQAPAAANKFGIRSVPTVIVFKNGIPMGSLIGAAPRPKLDALIAQVL